METKGYWRGKALEEFTKEELIDIIVEMGKMQQQTHEQHRNDLEKLAANRGRR